MNRRAFLTGLIASSALATCPIAIEAVLTAAPVTNWEAYFEQWQRDAIDIMVKCWEDQIIYGTSAYKTTDVYPFIERIDPMTLELPHLRGGLFND
jgi:hypothetical protein